MYLDTAQTIPISFDKWMISFVEGVSVVVYAQAAFDALIFAKSSLILDRDFVLAKAHKNVREV